MVLCLSDAFTESYNEDGQLLGTEGIQTVVESIDPTNPENLIPELRSRISSMHSGNLLQDDATAMLFEADGSQPSVKDNLMAPIRYFRGARDSANE